LGITVTGRDRDFLSPPLPASRSPRAFICASNSPALISARIGQLMRFVHLIAREADVQ
jgi:hypothetical protein